MSTQSIIEFDKISTCNKIDDFLICEGNHFRNIIDYDINHKIDYEKLNKIIFLKELMERTNDCENVLKTINKILI